MEKIIANIDGGARNNPGPAGIGVAVFENGKLRKKYSEYIGKKTNNEAEYESLIFALKKMKLLYGKKEIKKREVEIRSDSKLVVKQMKGKFKIKSEKTQPLFLKAWNLNIDIGKAKFKLVPREKNKVADSLVNEAIDKKTKKQKLF